MNVTKIEWTDVSWPVVNGCEDESPGCLNCYAKRLISTRLRHQPKYKSLAVYKERGPKWTGETRLWEPDLDAPKRRRKPSRVFVADMGDLFYKAVTDEDIDRVFAAMEAAPQHTYQILTKRAPRLRAYVSQRVAANGIAENMHLGVSVESQRYADERVPELIATPAAVRFLSIEPLLGPVVLKPEWVRHLDWVIIGGESGPGARPCHIEWTRAIVRSLMGTGVAVFVKQLGIHVIDPARWYWKRFEDGSRHLYRLPNDVRKPVPKTYDRVPPSTEMIAHVFPKGSGEWHWTTYDNLGLKANGGSVMPSSAEEAMADALRSVEMQCEYDPKKWTHALTLFSHKGGRIEEWPEDLRIRELPKKGRAE